MDGNLQNDLSEVVANDKAHVWHHLIQHKMFETADPNIIVEGKGMRVWNQAGKEHLDAVSGGVWTVNVGYGRESIADAVRDQLVKMNYFAGSALNSCRQFFQALDRKNAWHEPGLFLKLRIGSQ